MQASNTFGYFIYFIYFIYFLNLRPYSSQFWLFYITWTWFRIHDLDEIQNRPKRFPEDNGFCQNYIIETCIAHSIQRSIYFIRLYVRVKYTTA